MSDIFSLTEKNILVTGASSGLGRAIAVTCAQAGATVVLTARNEERLQETLRMMPAGEHRILPYDIQETEQLDNFVEQLPPLDGVVLSAGILRTVPVQFIQEEDLQQVFQTNTLSPMLMIQRLMKRRCIQRGGSVVFISSIAAISAAYGNGIYAASKGALNAFTRVMALETAALKIRCNCIQPGLIRTGISDRRVITEEDLQREEKGYPLGQGEAADIANGALYLLSDASRWVTGTCLTIDGGATLKYSM